MSRKGSMTKEQALEALKEGKKVGRTLFSSNEYIYMDGGVMRFEDGVYVSEWWNEIEPTFHKSEDGLDWYVVE